MLEYVIYSNSRKDPQRPRSFLYVPGRLAVGPIGRPAISPFLLDENGFIEKDHSWFADSEAAAAAGRYHLVGKGAISEELVDYLCCIGHAASWDEVKVIVDRALKNGHDRPVTARLF